MPTIADAGEYKGDPDDIDVGYRWDPSDRRRMQHEERAAIDVADRLVRFPALFELWMLSVTGTLSIFVAYALVPTPSAAFPFSGAAVIASRTAFALGIAVVCWETQSALVGWLESKQLARLRISLTKIHERLLEENPLRGYSATVAKEPESPTRNLEGFGVMERVSRNVD